VPNVWGTSMPVSYPAKQILGSSPNCPAGVETTIWSQTLAAVSPGFYYPIVQGLIWVQNGATPPSQVVVAAKIGAGADFDSDGAPQSVFTANALYIMPFTLIGPSSEVPWRGAGSVVNMTVNPTAQAVTINGNGAFCWFSLVRAPDQ
jgi:hypothetical protein